MPEKGFNFAALAKKIGNLLYFVETPLILAINPNLLYLVRQQMDNSMHRLGGLCSRNGKNRTLRLPLFVTA